MQKFLRWSCPLIALVLFSACMGNSSPPPPIYYYTLDYPSPSVTLNRQLPVTLRVERFSVSPPFQTQRIIYAGKGPDRNAYAYHQWIAAPGELLPYLLVRDFRSANGFKAVLTPDASLSASHSIYGWIEEFMEKDGDSNWHASATIHITLISNLNPDPSQKIMLQKRYHAAYPCKEKTPSALAEAMGIVVADLSNDIVRDVHQRLSESVTLHY